jgi:hypothetical protein
MANNQSVHHQQPVYIAVQKLWQKLRARKNYYHHRKTDETKTTDLCTVMGFSNIEITSSVQAFPENETKPKC